MSVLPEAHVFLRLQPALLGCANNGAAPDTNNFSGDNHENYEPKDAETDSHFNLSH